MPPVAKKMTRLRVTVVSLVDAGANKLPIVLKSLAGAGDIRVWKSIARPDEDGSTLYGIVAIPNVLDAHGEWADAETIKKAAHEFLVDGGKYDINHDLKMLDRDAVHVAESFIIQKNDPRFKDWIDRDGHPVNPENGWGIVLKINDPQIKERVKKGEIGGLSMYGAAARVDDNPPQQQPVSKMALDQTDLQKITDAITAALAPVVKALTPAASAAAAAPAAFDPDNASPEEVVKHVHKMRVLALKEDCDLQTIEGLQEYAVRKQELEQERDAQLEEIRVQKRHARQAGRAGGFEPSADGLVASRSAFSPAPRQEGQQVFLPGTQLLLDSASSAQVTAVQEMVRKRFAKNKPATQAS